MTRTLRYHRYTVGVRLASALLRAIVLGRARTVERIVRAARRVDVERIVGERIHAWALYAPLDTVQATLAARVRYACLVEVTP